MNRIWAFISLIVIAFLLSGCATYEKERMDLTSANVELRKELVKKEDALKYHQKVVADQKAEIAELEKENTALTTKVSAIDKKGQPEQAAEIKQPAQAQAEKSEASLKSLRIKILAGALQMKKARIVSTTLIKSGYKIARLDRVPKTFAQTTVYYAADHQDAGGIIAKEIGKAVTKPLSWKSEFDIIIAVGKAK